MLQFWISQLFLLLISRFSKISSTVRKFHELPLNLGMCFNPLRRVTSFLTKCYLKSGESICDLKSGERFFHPHNCLLSTQFGSQYFTGISNILVPPSRCFYRNFKLCIHWAILPHFTKRISRCPLLRFVFCGDRCYRVYKGVSRKEKKTPWRPVCFYG